MTPRSRRRLGWIFAGCCLMALLLHARTLGRGSTVRDFLVTDTRGHGYSDKICVWRTAEGGFIADHGYGPHEDRPGMLDTIETHYACVMLGGTQWQHGFYARTRAWREARIHVMRYNHRIVHPNELGVRDAVVRWAKRNLPEAPWAWAYDTLAVRDAFERRVILSAYANNLLGIALLLPAVWMTGTAVRRRKAKKDESAIRSCAKRHVCFGCKYDLRGITSDVCPECGTKTPSELLRNMASATAEDAEKI